jgi:hypothetical protein
MCRIPIPNIAHLACVLGDDFVADLLAHGVFGLSDLLVNDIFCVSNRFVGGIQGFVESLLGIPSPGLGSLAV